MCHLVIVRCKEHRELEPDDEDMGVPLVGSFCCGWFSLSTGTLLIGYFYTIAALIELVVRGLLVTLLPLDDMSPRRLALLITQAVVCALQLLCGLMLIIGATKGRAWLLLPWTIVTGLLAVIYFMISLTGMSLMLQDRGKTLLHEIPVVLYRLISACVSVYCVVVVHSRHKQIMMEQKQKLTDSVRLYKPVRPIYQY